MTHDLRLTAKLLFCFLLFTFHFSFVKAQDTTRPVIMSQSYYDSILNALKKAPVKQKDTANQVVHDTVKSFRIPAERGLLLVNDSANKASMKRALDSAVFHYHKADSLRKSRQQRHIADGITKTDTLLRVKKRQISTGYIALNFGIGLPISDYATVAGASAGRNVSICAEFPGQKSRFGWAFKFDYGYNGINSSQYMHNISDTVYTYDQGLVYYQIPLGTNYVYYSLMAGICKSIPLGRLTFDARMLIGVLHGTIPQTSYIVTDTTIWNNITVNRYKASANSFAFSFGLDARYLILPNLSVLLNFDYLTARPTFQLVSSGFAISYSGIIPVATHLTTFTQPFMLNNLTLGVAYTITAKKIKR